MSDQRLTIGTQTFDLLLRSMTKAMEVIDRDSQYGSDLALMPAMFSALDGDREAVLRDVAVALSPGSEDDT
jgi:hypothetical protein